MSDKEPQHTSCVVTKTVLSALRISLLVCGAMVTSWMQLVGAIAEWWYYVEWALHRLGAL